ncbi:hypothetical protein D3C85_1620920 [compost metagenome]
MSPNPFNASVIDFPGSPGAKTCVKAVKAMAIIHMVPIGAAFRIIPKMVATNMANKCQASGTTPFGAGINQIAAPTASVIRV